MTLPSSLVAPLALTGLSTDPAAPDAGAGDPAGDRPPLRGRPHAAASSSPRPTRRSPCRPQAPSTPSAWRRRAPRSSVPQVDAARSRAPSGAARWWVLLGVARRPGAARLGRRRCSGAGAAAAGVSAVEPDGEDVPLRFEGVTKAYKDGFVAVRDLSFEVRRGQVLGLLGPNGAGKTTSLRMLMGLIRPDRGPDQHLRPRGRARAPRCSPGSGSFVEGTGLQPHLSGRDNLTLYWAATGRPLADAHLEEAIEVAGLGTAIDKRVRRYSQGMRQRVAIAQAMLGLPDLLVLDEPTNGLDPPQIHAMREVLRSYAATGRTVIVSSHLLSRDRADLQPRRRHGQGREDRPGHRRGDRGHRGAVLVGLADAGGRRPRDRRARPPCPGSS